MILAVLIVKARLFLLPAIKARHPGTSEEFRLPVDPLSQLSCGEMGHRPIRLFRGVRAVGSSEDPWLRSETPTEDFPAGTWNMAFSPKGRRLSSARAKQTGPTNPEIWLSRLAISQTENGSRLCGCPR